MHRSRRPLAVVLAVLIAAACASTGRDAAGRTSVIAALLSPLGISVEEIGIRDLAEPLDHWRLRLVDHLLAHPLGAVATVRGIADEFYEAGGSLMKTVSLAARLLDIDVRPVGDDTRSTRVVAEADLAFLPPELRTVVVDLLDAMAEAAPRLRAASAGLPPEDREFILDFLLASVRPSGDRKRALDESDTWRFVELAGRFDRTALAEGSLIIAGAVDRAVATLQGWRGRVVPHPSDPSWRTLAEGDVVAVLRTALGPVVIGGPGPTIHHGGAALVIDLGGDDTYFGRAGGAVGPDRPVSIIIDLQGNDRYVAEVDVAQGAGAFGVAVLVDLDGDDTYSARDIAQGAGAFGIGLLYDVRGRDRYQAGTHAQGAAAFGIGALIDGGDDDRYRAVLSAQGFGGTAGLGLLLDASGDDRYVIAGGPPEGPEPGHTRTLGQGFGFGLRPVASGGIGLLVDWRGSDRYEGDYFTQGGGYWYGLGALVDEAGDDEYSATRFAQGAGIHFSVGVLWDGGGNDRYQARQMAQGMGHDYGVGILADADGNDVYEAVWLAQGAGNADGFGLLVDLAGDDRYRGQGDDVQGVGQAARRLQSLGLLIDVGGNDVFSRTPTGVVSWSRGGWGGALHAEATNLGFPLAPRRPEPSSLPRTPPSFPPYRRPDDPRFAPRDDQERRVHALLEEALNSDETTEAAERRDSARKTLAGLGAAAAPALVRVLESLNIALAAQAIDTLNRLGAAAHPTLFAALDHPNWLVRRRASSVLTRRPAPEVARATWARTGADPDPRLRAIGAEGLGRACFEDGRGWLAALLAGDASIDVRYAAVRSLARLAAPEVDMLLAEARADRAYQVRLAAQQALRDRSSGRVDCRKGPR